MVDCKWAESQIEARLDLQSRVLSADKFALASGLMEITYDTGARSFCRDR